MKKKLVGWALWRKCSTFKDWSIDHICVEDEGKRDIIRQMRDNRLKDWSKLINLKQKISKVTVIAEK